jgi:polar amino acid transport system permease protein
MELWRRLIWNQRAVYLDGFVVTLEICAIAFAVAVVLGLAVCLIRLYVRPLRWLAIFHIEFCRSTPIYVQLMWVNYVWPDLFGWPQDYFNAGWTALALQSSGYLAETFRAGIEGIARGQREAAYSLGMSRALTLRRIVLPQVFVTMAPSIMNQLIVVVKSSTLVSESRCPTCSTRRCGWSISGSSRSRSCPSPHLSTSCSCSCSRCCSTGWPTGCGRATDDRPIGGGGNG